MTDGGLRASRFDTGKQSIAPVGGESIQGVAGLCSAKKRPPGTCHSFLTGALKPETGTLIQPWRVTSGDAANHRVELLLIRWNPRAQCFIGVDGDRGTSVAVLPSKLAVMLNVSARLHYRDLRFDGVLSCS